MKIAIQDIKEVPTVATFAEDVTQLNAMLGHGVRDYSASGPIGVSVSYYRAGMDIFLGGELWAQLEGTCSRCLVEYPFRLAKNFDLVMVPQSEAGPSGLNKSGPLSADDLAVSYYGGDEIDVSPIVQEQLILALPTRPLCSTDCRGLCSQCGASLNAGDCGCVVNQGDPRLAILHRLKISG